LSDTKGHALAIRRHLERHAAIDSPINIHLTGCPNSCAQHYVGDIGLLGAQVATDSGTVEGYHLYVGGASDHERGLGREIAKGLPFEVVPVALARLVNAYAARRLAGETFLDFTRRHDVDALRAMVLEAPP